MATRFDNNAIAFGNNPNPNPPNNSNEVKLFNDNGELKTVDFSGSIKPLAPELKVAQVEVNTNEDANEYVLRIPSPNAKLQALEQSLKAAIAESSETALNNFQEAIETVRSYSESQNLANGLFAKDIIDLQTALDDLRTVVDGKASQEEVDSRFNRLSSDLLIVVENINNTLATKASRTYVDAAIQTVRDSIPPGIDIRAGNITINNPEGSLTVRSDGNIRYIDVDFPRGAVEAVAQQVVSGGGAGVRYLNKLKDVVLNNLQNGQTLVWNATNNRWENGPGGSGGGKPITSPLSTIDIVDTGTEYQIDVADYIGATEVYSISGDLSARILATEAAILSNDADIAGLTADVAYLSGAIDQIVQEGTTIESTDGTINVDQTLLNFDLSVNDYISKTEVQTISSGLDGRIDVLESNPIPDIFRAEVAGISADLQDQIDAIVQESTTIESSGGSIVVTQTGPYAYNLEVASAPIQNHNDLLGLQGGTTNEYYHLTADQFNDYIGSSEVAAISGGLDTRITNIESDYLTSSDLLPYITAIDVALISSNLQNQIDAIVQESTTIESSGGSIVVTQTGPYVYNLEVASAPIQDHNDLNGLQGGTTNEYYHLNISEYSSVVSLPATIQNIENAIDDLDSVTVKITGDQTINGVKTFSDDAVFNGDVFVNGTQFVVNTEHVSAADNIITINAGEIGPGVTAGFAGIEVDRGSSPDYQFVFRESDDSFVIGEVGDYQAVATREDSPINNGFARWNASESRFDTTLDVASASHTHTTSDITNLSSYTGFDARYYTETEVNTLLSGKSDTSHNHTLDSLSNVTITSNTNGEILRWNGTAWINNTLAEAGIAAASHTHTTSDITNLSSYTGFDARYYTETEVNTLLSGKSDTSHNHTLDSLSNVTITSNTNGEILRWNGTAWINNTLAEAGIQPSDATLTSLAAYNTNGILTQTATDTFTGRTITGTTNQVTVTNGNGVAGNPTLSLPQNIHTAATPTFARLTLSQETGTAPLTITSTTQVNNLNADLLDGQEGSYYQNASNLNAGTIPAARIANNLISNAMIRDSDALSVIGRSANSTGDPADISAGTDGHVLRRSGTTLGFGTIETAGIADNAVTNGKLADMAPTTIKGRFTNSLGDPEDITVTQLKQLTQIYYLHYTRGTNLAITSGNNITFNTLNTALSGLSGTWTGTIFNPPVSGVYMFNFGILMTASLANLGIGLNDVATGNMLQRYRLSSSVNAIQASFIQYLNANQQVSLRIMATGTILGSDLDNYIQIYRL